MLLQEITNWTEFKFFGLKKSYHFPYWDNYSHLIEYYELVFKKIYLFPYWNNYSHLIEYYELVFKKIYHFPYWNNYSHLIEYYELVFKKISFLRKNQTDHTWKSEKGEVIADNMAPKSYFLLFVMNYNWDPQYEFGDQL